MQNNNAPIARFLVVSAAFIVVVAGMRAAESMLVPFLLSLFIAVIFSPPLAWMNQKGVPNALAILIVIGCIVIVGVVVGAVLGQSITDFKSDLPDYSAKLETMSVDVKTWLVGLGIPIETAQWKQSVNPGAALSIAGNTLSSFGNVMTNAFMILLTTVFILAEEVGFSDKFRRAYGDSEKTLDAIGRFTKSVNQYIAIKSALSLLTGFLIFVWLWILDVDYPVLWGLMAFLLNYVPTLGSILAAVPAVLLALVQLGPFSSLLVGLGYVAVNIGVGNVLEPRITGKGLGLSALIVFLSLVFWGWVLGPVGMLLSVPLTMTVKIALESFEETRWLGVMLGSGKIDEDVVKTIDETDENLA
ncbi:MAG: AI-2E family transporter [Cellvibrionaceae bacterium]